MMKSETNPRFKSRESGQKEHRSKTCATVLPSGVAQTSGLCVTKGEEAQTGRPTLDTAELLKILNLTSSPYR
jgi:hypothetical protein